MSGGRMGSWWLRSPMGSNALLQPGLPLDRWLGWPDPINQLVVLCPNFDQKAAAQGQSGDRSKLCFVFITWVYCVLSPGAHLLECHLCASPCWTRWWVGTKCNESFRNITWHPEIKKDYGKKTRIQTLTLKTNALTTPTTIGHGFW